MQFDRQIKISVANTRYGPWQVQQYTLSQLYAKLSQPARGDECRAAYLALPKRDQDRLKDVGGFVGGALKDSVRQRGHVVSRSLITLDVDKLEAGGANRVLRICESLGCGYAIYSTRKHAPEAPRLRIILPLAEDLTADEYEPAARYAASIIDPTMQMFDRTTFQAERLMYWPSVCSDGEYVFTYSERQLVDGHALLRMGDWKDVTKWPRCPDETAAVQRTASKQQDPTTKEGLVGAFCRVYDVYSVMDKFIPGVYEAVGNSDNRFTYTGGSTSGGAVVYEDGKFLYSNHATDPAGGQLCNAFDLVRLHLFGAQDDSAKPGTPTVKLPSWQAMCKMAENDPVVHGQKVSDRAEQIKRDFADQIAAATASSDAVPQAGGNTPLSAAASAPAATQAGGTVSAPVEDVAVRLAELLEDSKSKVTSPLVEAAMAAMGVRIGRNEITGRVVIEGLPAQFSAEEAPNTIIVLVSDFLRQNGINAAPDGLKPYIGLIADKYRFNPVKDWLLAGAWDGFDRWPLIYEILGIEGEENQKYHTYVRKWFMQCVALALNDHREPRSADGALILQGPQGCGKTLFFKKMSVCRDWFKEGVSIDLNPNAKDTVIKALSGWITELGELDSTLKREQVALKAFITAERDEVRLPYAPAATNRLRRTSFCGTVNPEDFLRDETGSRRFWVVPVTQISVQQLLSISPETVSQVWYQAYCEWRANPEEYRLNGSERAGLERDNAQYEAGVLWQEELEDLMDWSIPDEDRQEVSAAWLAQSVLRNGAKAGAVGKALGAIAKVHSNVVYVRKANKRVWLLPIKKTLSVLYGA